MDFDINKLNEEIIRKSDLLKYLLEKKGLRLTTAESITGGRIISSVAAIPGASKVIYSGVVVYSIDSKIDIARVSYKTIEDKGVVSLEVAEEMAKFGPSKCVCISTTGWAGEVPGETPQVWIGVRVNNKIIMKNYEFENYGVARHDRENHIRLATFLALEIAIRELTN